MWITYVIVATFFCSRQFVSGTVTDINITGPDSVNERESVTLTCNAVCTNGNCLYSWTGFGFTPPVTTDTLSLSPVFRNYSSKPYNCTVRDTDNSPETTPDFHFVVNYGPDSVTVAAGPAVTVIEDETSEGKNIVCAAEACSPECNFVWTKGGTNDTVSGAKLFPTNRRISRDDAGDYTCTASNGKTPAKTAHVAITVHYAPRVELSWNPTSSIITCTASGNPRIYTFDNLEQYVGDISVRSFPGTTNGPTATFDIGGEDYQSTGRYICSVNNGIANHTTGVLKQSGTKYINVEDLPVLVHSEENYNVSKGGELPIQILLYSYPLVNEVALPADDMDFTCGTQGGGNIALTCEERNVEIAFHGKEVTTEGQSLTLTFNAVAEENFFKPYTFHLRNTVGEITTNVTLFPQGAPDTPTSFHKSETTHNSVTFVLVTGYFNGGGQTIIVEHKLPGNQASWINSALKFAGIEKNQRLSIPVEDLDAETSYEFRAYAYNEYGRSPYTKVVMETTNEEPVSAGLIAGSVVGGVVVIAIVVGVIITVCRRRKKDPNRGTFVKENKDLTLQMPTSPPYENQNARTEHQDDPVTPDPGSKNAIYENTIATGHNQKSNQEKHVVSYDSPRSTEGVDPYDIPRSQTKAASEHVDLYDNPRSQTNDMKPTGYYYNVQSQMIDPREDLEVYDSPRTQTKDFRKPTGLYDSPRSRNKDTPERVEPYDFPRSQKTYTPAPLELYDTPRSQGATEINRKPGNQIEGTIPSYLDLNNPDAIEEVYLNVDQSKELLKQSSSNSNLVKQDTVTDDVYLEMNVVEGDAKTLGEKESPYYNTRTSETYENTALAPGKGRDYQNVSKYKKEKFAESKGEWESNSETKDYQNVAKYKKVPTKQPSVDSQSDLYMAMDTNSDRKSVLSIPDYQAPPPPGQAAITEEDYMNIRA